MAPTLQCPPLPNPVLAIDRRTEEGDFHLVIANATAYPDVLFAPSPDLPPCGLNPQASRTWIEIRDARGPYLYGYCAVRSASELSSTMFLPGGLASPEVRSIVVVLNDRRCGVMAVSNQVPLPGR